MRPIPPSSANQRAPSGPLTIEDADGVASAYSVTSPAGVTLPTTRPEVNQIFPSGPAAKDVAKRPFASGTPKGGGRPSAWAPGDAKEADAATSAKASRIDGNLLKLSSPTHGASMCPGHVHRETVNRQIAQRFADCRAPHTEGL